MTARLVHIHENVIANDAGVPYANQSVSVQVYSLASLLKYKVSGQPQEIRTNTVDTVDTGSDGSLDLFLTAPTDMVGVAFSGDFDPQAYYVITLPGGQKVPTTTFAYTGSVLSLSDITDLTASPALTTAPLHIVRAKTASDAGDPVVVHAYLSANGFIDGVFLPNDVSFDYELPTSGDGIFNLPPNDLITPSGTVWTIYFGDSSLGIPVIVPIIGGDFLACLAGPMAPPDLLSPEVSDGGTSYIVNTAAGTISTAGLTRACWLHLIGAGGTLGNVKLYDAATAVGTPFYDETPSAPLHLDLQVPLLSGHLTIVAAAATTFIVTVRS